MTNAQLYLAIGIPSIISILGFLTQGAAFNARFTAIEKRMDDMVARLTGIEAAMRGLYESMGL